MMHCAVWDTTEPPPSFGTAQREVDVFVVEEIALVEATEVCDEWGAQQDRSTREDRDVRCSIEVGSVGFPESDVASGASRVQHHTDAVDQHGTGASEQDLRLHATDPFVGGDVGQQWRQPTGAQQ